MPARRGGEGFVTQSNHISLVFDNVGLRKALRF